MARTPPDPRDPSGRMLDTARCYRALQTRDARFDGRFFTGVRTTGVYCRPVCPARTPLRRNCAFFPSAAAAQEAGFRPCLRCRPEASPGTPAWAGSHATVARALRLIGEGALDEGGVPALAARLGVGDRHLRRLFLRHLGASPLAVARTRRVLFAKKLLDETGLPVTQVAFASGFGSVRRFNDAVRAAWGRSPRALRRRPASRPTAALELKLPYRPPLGWPALLGFLAARATPGVEQVADGVYRRTLRAGTARGTLEVRALADEPSLVARIDLDGPANLAELTERVRRVFDLGADPAAIAAHLGRDPQLAALLAGLPGVRVPGTVDPFEWAVRTVLGQQVSVAAATTLAGRLVRARGERLPGEAPPGAPAWLFPTPQALASSELTELGIPRARAEALRALARAVASDGLALDGALDLDAAVAQLCALPGIGEWTAHVIALRAFQEPDAFPAGDLGVRRALGAPGPPLSARDAAVRAEAWRPWRGYAALLLWSAPASASAPSSRPGRRAVAGQSAAPGTGPARSGRASA